MNLKKQNGEDLITSQIKMFDKSYVVQICEHLYFKLYYFYLKESNAYF